MRFTLEDIQKFVAENREDISKSLQESEEVPSVFKRAKPEGHIGKIWDAGCWLSHILGELGASEEQKTDICFAHGQRCFGGDPFEVALQYANAFAETQQTPEQPGEELAEQIFDETIGRIIDEYH